MDKEQWIAKSKEIKIPNQMFIDGEFVSAVSGATFDAISPIDQKVLAKVASGDSQDVDQAVAAAKRTFENGVWRDLNPRDKKAIMLKWADLIREHFEEIALLETLEVEIGRAHV